MAVELYLTRRLNRLCPVGPGDEEALRELPEGRVLRVKVTRLRNVQHHRKFMALLGAVFPHQSAYATFDDFRKAIAIELGHFRTCVLLDGRTMVEAKSISFAQMDQLQFDEFYTAAVELICAKVIPGINKPELEQQVEEILEGRQYA
jgi:hypothetical protein